MESFEVLAIAVAVLVILYYYLTLNFDYWEMQGVKHDKPWPIIGNLIPLWQKTLEKQDMYHYNKFGKIYGTFEGSNPALHVAEPELLRKIFVKDFDCFTQRRSTAHGKKNHFSNKFLMNMEHAEWRDSRQTFSSTFSAKKLKPLLDCMDNSSKNFRDLLRNHSDSNQCMDIKECFNTFIMDVFAAYALGIEVNAMTNTNNPLYINAGLLFTQIPHLNAFLYLLFPKIMTYVMSFFPTIPLYYLKNVVEKIMDTKTEQKGQVQSYPDIMQILMDNKKNLHADTINAQLMLYLGAYDTVATSAAFACYELAVNPDCQEKLINEIDDVMAATNCKLQYENFRNMPYLDMVVHESLRKYPIATRVERVCNVDNYELNGIKLKKGMLVTVPVYPIHYDEELYPNPTEFDPERFNQENKSKRPPFTFMTFGSGPRNCIGIRLAILSLKLCLVHLLSQFRLTKCAKTPIPLNVNTIGFGFINLTEMFLQVTHRTDQPQSQ